MFVKACLSLAIICGIAVAVLSFTQLGPKIEGLNTQITTLEGEKKTATDLADKRGKDLKTATNELRSTYVKLGQTSNELVQVTSRATQQERRANDLQDKWETVTKERNGLDMELASWRATGLTPDRINSTIAALKKANGTNEALMAEAVVLNRKIRDLDNQLKEYKDPLQKVEMRVGLKGKVLVVDPKWEFVVLDIGSEQGAERRGEMLVSREGKLVAKVRLTNVDRTRSIANIIPETKQGDVMEGDQVIYY